MRIYATSRSAVVKGALAMIGFVALADVVMILILVHVLNRTVSLTAQWPIAVLVLGVIGVSFRSYNLAGKRWVEVTPKQLKWASGPRAAKAGLAPTGAVKLAELASVTVVLDEYQDTEGRKTVTARAHRLHAEIEGKPTVVLPVVAEVHEDLPPAVREAGRARLLKVIEQINTQAANITVDTTVLDLEVAEAEAAETDAKEAGTEDVEVSGVKVAEAEVTETQTAEVETTESEATETETTETETTESEATEVEVEETEAKETEVTETETEVEETEAESETDKAALADKAELSD